MSSVVASVVAAVVAASVALVVSADVAALVAAVVAPLDAVVYAALLLPPQPAKQATTIIRAVSMSSARVNLDLRIYFPSVLHFRTIKFVRLLFGWFERSDFVNIIPLFLTTVNNNFYSVHT